MHIIPKIKNFIYILDKSIGQYLPRNYTSVAKPFALTINGLNSMTNGTTSTLGVRPVINIKADTQITGSGTSTDPFKVVGAS